MCRFYCTSEGSATNLACLHCGKHYCSVCLVGEGGEMASLLKCSTCGRKPQSKPNRQRQPWNKFSAPPVPLRSPDRITHYSGTNDKALSFQFLSSLRIEDGGAGGAAEGGNDDGREADGAVSQLPVTMLPAGPPIQGSTVEAQLDNIFHYYCHFAPAASGLNIAKWTRCIRELGLFEFETKETRLKKTEVDLIFMRLKPHKAKTIDLETFYQAMLAVANAKFNAGGGAHGHRQQQRRRRLRQSAGRPPAGPQSSSPDAMDMLKRLLAWAMVHKGTRAQKKQRLDAAVSAAASGQAGAVAHWDSVTTRKVAARRRHEQARYEQQLEQGEGQMQMYRAGEEEEKESKQARDGTRHRDIYDRLTDTNLYTGTHRLRFDSQGHGRGRYGRDSPMKGNGSIPSFARSIKLRAHDSSMAGPTPALRQRLDEQTPIAAVVAMSRSMPLPRGAHSEHALAVSQRLLAQRGRPAGEGSYGRKEWEETGRDSLARTQRVQRVSDGLGIGTGGADAARSARYRELVQRLTDTQLSAQRELFAKSALGTYQHTPHQSASGSASSYQTDSSLDAAFSFADAELTATDAHAEGAVNSNAATSAVMVGENDEDWSASNASAAAAGTAGVGPAEAHAGAGGTEADNEESSATESVAAPGTQHSSEPVFSAAAGEVDNVPVAALTGDELLTTHDL